MPIQERPSSITAFFGRGKEVGFVCLKHGDLIDFGVKTITGRRRGGGFTKKIQNTLSALLETPEQHGLIVVERVSEMSYTGGLRHAMNAVSKRWKKDGYSVCSISLKQVKQRLCGTPNATHRELMEEVAERHAILKVLMADGKADNAHYWEKVVLAMALVDKES